ncbi:MAG: reverse transcriptase domain-containing protein [Saprospiraceae bacterium]
MQRIGNLYPQFCSFENLLLAYRKARRGTRSNLETAAFFHQMEPELLALQAELASGVWQPQPYRYFEIYDPKQRTISVAAFRDRVVHHALVNVLEPIFERRFIFDSYATRKGKGVHAAVARAQHFLRSNGWFFKTDVEKYFDSIDHGILLGLLQRKIKDRQLLEVCEKIVRNGGAVRQGLGLPIGNLTSQFFANVYLDPLDHFVADGGAGGFGSLAYLRYMDDFVIFSENKEHLKCWRPSIEIFLAERLALQLKPSATFLNSRENGLSFLGRRIFPATVRLHPQHLRRITSRLARREKSFLVGEITEETFVQSSDSYWAMLAFHPTLPLRRALAHRPSKF